MHILIAGSEQSGQREALELLTNRKYDQSSLKGLVTEHEFQTAYFNAPCGLWVDEITDYAEWAGEFCSVAAQEVRDSLVLFVYTYDPAQSSLLTAKVPKLAQFVSMLNPGISVAMAVSPTTSPNSLALITDSLVESGFDVISQDELIPIVHSALYDAQSGIDPKDEDEVTTSDDIEPTASQDLDSIVQELMTARDSATMTDKEKRALAERLAGELV